MRKTKNITVAASERTHHGARMFSAAHGQSVSAVVQFILENLPQLSKAIRNLLAENRNSAALPRLANFINGDKSEKESIAL